MKILVINGPNLNMLGKREPDVYGSETYDDLKAKVLEHAEKKGIECDIRQSNHEGVIVDWIQEADAAFDGIVMNPAALTHYSVAVLDAIRSISIPVIEVHISNIHAREEFRKHSVTASAVKGIIAGFGTDGYTMAIDGMNNILDR